MVIRLLNVLLVNPMCHEHARHIKVDFISFIKVVIRGGMVTSFAKSGFQFEDIFTENIVCCYILYFLKKNIYEKHLLSSFSFTSLNKV